jgi:NAD(P)-dependent dehydrogenase (short-subunit alcohol dehydrogenase family)
MTCLVTGAAGGIGRAIYDTLRKGGERVVAQDIGAGENVDPALVGDLCDQDFLSRLENVLRETASDGLRAVVAAHGVAGAGRLDEISPSRAAWIMAVNFESVVNLWEKVHTELEKTGGSFVVVVSQAGLVGEAGNALYCASKFALSGWLRGLSGETSARLRAINPGGIRTPLLERALFDMANAQGITLEALTAKRYGMSPAGRIGDPKEVGELIDMALCLETPRLVEIAITGGEVLW